MGPASLIPPGRLLWLPLEVETGPGNPKEIGYVCWRGENGNRWRPGTPSRSAHVGALHRLPASGPIAPGGLPFPDASFDVVASSLGTVFAPEQRRMAHELLRVCRPCGQVALAAWTPDGFMGQLYQTRARHVAVPAGMQCPSRWGTRQRLTELFPSSVLDITPRTFAVRHQSPGQWLGLWRSAYAPLRAAFDGLGTRAQDRLSDDLVALIQRCNVAGDGSVDVRADYLEAIITNRSAYPWQLSI